MDFCLIFVPFGHCDEPEILRYANTSICPKGADVRQAVEGFPKSPFPLRVLGVLGRLGSMPIVRYREEQLRWARHDQFARVLAKPTRTQTRSTTSSTNRPDTCLAPWPTSLMSPHGRRGPKPTSRPNDGRF
jgi:hypothetical protein